jgi:secretion/DNA translocation related TadE-like protein
MRSARDRGSATIAVVGALAVLSLACAAAVTSSAVADASARAQGAADLSALAAATLARDERALGRIGAGEPCGLASSVAEANGATLTACDVSARGIVAVQVSVRIGTGPSGLAMTRRATAGPAGASG